MSLETTRAMSFVGSRLPKTLHHALVSRAIRLLMSFLDATPIGRIIHRFRSDMEAIDCSLANGLNQMLAPGYLVPGRLLDICLLDRRSVAWMDVLPDPRLHYQDFRLIASALRSSQVAIVGQDWSSLTLVHFMTIEAAAEATAIMDPFQTFNTHHYHNDSAGV